MHGNGDLTDDWSALVSLTACAHFGCSFGCVLLLNQIFLKTMYHSTIYYSNLSDQSALEIGLGLGLDSELHYFSIFHRE